MPSTGYWVSAVRRPAKWSHFTITRAVVTDLVMQLEDASPLSEHILYY